MEDRVILHCDLNNFFASVSLLFNPTLKGLPVAVCGDKENRHGIVLAKNEEAKSFGVKTAEAIFEAQAKCPELIILPAEMEKYHEYSERAYEIYTRYTDMIEPFGIDECWLDVSGSKMLFGDGKQISERIRREIKRELGITVSIGVSFNKVFAKLGSDMKKPDAITVISRENFKEIVLPLPISALLFAGKKTTDRLKSVGIYTIGDVANCPNDTLIRLLGKNGVTLKQYARGEDSSPVGNMHDEYVPKSVGRSVTKATDFENYDDVWKMILSLSQAVSDTLKNKNLYAGGVQIHIRTTSFAVKEVSRSFNDTTDCAYTIAKRGMELFKQSYNFGEPLRSVGIRAISLKSYKTAIQEDIFGSYSEDEKQEKIESSVYKLRQRFGKNRIMRATTLDV